MEVDNIKTLELEGRPRRTRCETQRILYGSNASKKTLQLEDVLRVLGQYVDYEGGINCSVCGKLYKSRVCFIKHIWEHSIYWDLFEGSKNHDRVLSIQAALILYNTVHTNHQVSAPAKSPNANDVLTSLLVTSPHDKKKDMNNNEGQSPRKGTECQKASSIPSKRSSPSKPKSPAKRKRTASSSSSIASPVAPSRSPLLMECSSGMSDSESSK